MSLRPTPGAGAARGEGDPGGARDPGREGGLRGQQRGGGVRGVESVQSLKRKKEAGEI